MHLLKQWFSKSSRFTSKAVYKNKCPWARPWRSRVRSRNLPIQGVTLVTQSLGREPRYRWPPRAPCVPVCWLGLHSSKKLRPHRGNTLWAASGSQSQRPGLVTLTFRGAKLPSLVFFKNTEVDSLVSTKWSSKGLVWGLFLKGRGIFYYPRPHKVGWRGGNDWHLVLCNIRTVSPLRKNGRGRGSVLYLARGQLY